MHFRMAHIISRPSVKPWVGEMAVAFANTFVAKLEKEILTEANY